MDDIRSFKEHEKEFIKRHEEEHRKAEEKFRKAKEQILKARAGLVLDHPFFATLVMSKEWKVDTQCETAWTDGTQYGFNPEYIDTLTLNQTKGLEAHEAGHPMLLHHIRRGERDPETWNEACDYVLNMILLDAGFELPPGYLYNKDFGSLNVDEVFNILWGRKQQERQKGKQQPKGGYPGQGTGTPGQEPQKPQPGQGTADPGKSGEVRDFPSPSGLKKPSDQEINRAIEEAKILNQQALSNGEKAGKIPGSLKRLISEMLDPVIPWTEVLSRFLDNHAPTDYNWKRRNKKYEDFFIPTLKAQVLGLIGIGIDTSGSIQQSQINRFMGEIKGIISSYKQTSCLVMFCDHQIQGDPVIIDTDDTEPLKPMGGGGTRFNPPFDYIETHQDELPEVKCFIYFTDGYSNDFPQTEPPYETLWIIIGTNKNFHPPFGEITYFKE